MSTQIIPVFTGIINQEEIKLVNARDLHQFLNVTSRFNDWINRRISEYGFCENSDFYSNLSKTNTGGRSAKEYHLTLDMAKELSMVERTEKGRQARKYFIECEKQLHHKTNNSNEKYPTQDEININPIYEKLGHFQMRQLTEIISVIASNYEFKDAAAKAIWKILREITYTPSPEHFDVRHIGIIKKELELILVVSRKYFSWQKENQIKVIKKIIREKFNFNEIIDDINKDFENKVFTWRNTADEKLKPYDQNIIDTAFCCIGGAKCLNIDS